MPASLKNFFLIESRMATEEYTPSIPSSTRHSYRVCQQDQETYEEYSESNVMYDGKYVFDKTN